MTLLYFAWVRERIGTAEETLALPDHVKTVADLLRWLGERGAGYASALSDLGSLRVAVNSEIVSLAQPLRETDEVAIFPPVTGGHA